jgi:hypothetical protein
MQQLPENRRVALPRLSVAVICQIFRPANREIGRFEPFW